jgi:hypothetical protein
MPFQPVHPQGGRKRRIADPLGRGAKQDLESQPPGAVRESAGIARLQVRATDDELLKLARERLLRLVDFFVPAGLEGPLSAAHHLWMQVERNV